MSAATWTIGHVCGWLESEGLGHLAPIFRQNRIDGKALLGLTKDELRDELSIQALGDRKVLWEKIESLQSKKVSPRVAAAPATAGGWCDYCKNVFASSDVPVTMVHPTTKSRVQLHQSCKGNWERRNCTRCHHCNEVVTDIQTLTGPWGRVELHPHCVSKFQAAQIHGQGSGIGKERCDHCFKQFDISESPILLTLPGKGHQAKLHLRCKSEYSKLHAKKCDHCLKPMPTDVTTLSGTWGSADLHPECVRAFEDGLRRGSVGSGSPHSRGGTSPRRGSTSGDAPRCAHCLAQFTRNDVPILLTLPGQTKSAELHPHCKAEWARLHAKRCDHCHEPMPHDITTLTGAWGKADVHPDCVAGYEAQLASTGRIPAKKPTTPPPRRGSSPSTGRRTPSPDPERCAHCMKLFTVRDTPILLRLPGESKSARLHQHCKADYANRHAKLCDECYKPMPTDITTLTGPWGTVDVHPGCVASFEKKHRRGGVSPRSSAVGEDRCQHCFRGFRDGEVATILTLPGEKTSAKLHPGCKDDWARLHAKKCAHCHLPMPEGYTTLSGIWGSADLHQACVAPYERSRSR
eukprot:Sspe_Gene.82289::Locus_53930_Transcript_2_3_Confidence_0.500_Length_2077::g.82289::m.82289